MCTCQQDFTGKQCEFPLGSHSCEENPCKNKGSCIAHADSGYHCDCVPGWIGKNCELNFNDCASTPCMNGGICIDGINNYTCRCDRTGQVLEYKKALTGRHNLIIKLCKFRFFSLVTRVRIAK